MTVTCPNCKTIYNLSPEVARPNAKLRCTVCKHVFAMPLPDAMAAGGALDAQPEAGISAAGETLSINIGDGGKPSPASGKKRLPLVLLLVLLLLGGTGAALWFFTPYLDPIKARFVSKPVVVTEADKLAQWTAMVGKIQVYDYKQYTVQNEKLGKLVVVEGKTVNKFDEPRELIQVEVRLFDAAGKEVASKTQYAGAKISLFQLQMLGAQELEQTLNNKLDILSNNSNIPPGGQVPFMVVFYSSPPKPTPGDKPAGTGETPAAGTEDAASAADPLSTATDFSVRVAGASKPETKP